MIGFFFFKQKTAYEIKECDWSSDVCSSDLLPQAHGTDADYAGGRQPTSAYPETRPTAAIPIPGSPIVGSPIPGSFRAGSGSVGHYRDQTYARPHGPGVARLQGVIEKPSVRTTYDYTRPGVY